VRKPLTYREIFFAHNGIGPWPCFECGENVFAEELYVHHSDHDHYNDEPGNLVAAHPGCHSGYHKRMRGDRQTDYQKLRASETHRGRKKTPEEIAKRVAARRANAAKRGARW